MAGHNDGFRSLGQLIAGGDPRRGEAAFLEGLNTGSQIRSRNASTESALAQARLRRDQARDRAAFRELGPDAISEVDRLSQLIGVNPQQRTGAELDVQELGFRETIADPTTARDVRQFAAQGVQGTVANPLQAAGGLITDVFSPDPLGTAATTPLTDSQIETNKARAKASLAAGALSDERRTNPDAFKSRLPASADPDVPLSEQILPGGKGDSIIPEGFVAEEGFGAESFIKGGANAFTDFVGLGVFFPEAAEAKTLLGELAARIQLTKRTSVFKPTAAIQDLLGRYSEEPQQLFRGDELGRQNLVSTLRALKRDLRRSQQKLDSPVKITATASTKLQDSIFAIADTIADLTSILDSIQRTEGDAPIVSKRKAAALEAGEPAFDQQVGETITLPNGDVILRND